jgi:hypothetical protein
MASLLDLHGQPTHFAMIACLEKMGQPLAHFQTETCLTKAERVKTELQRFVWDPVLGSNEGSSCVVTLGGGLNAVDVKPFVSVSILATPAVVGNVLRRNPDA